MPRSDKPLLALTLQHPHAACVAHLGKDIENRTWKPGKLQLIKGDFFAIHGGRAPKGKALEGILAHADELAERFTPGLILPAAADWAATEGIVAVACFDGTVAESESPWFRGPVGWVLEKVWALPEPIACPGRQGLWAIDPETHAEVRRQYGAALRSEREQRELFAS